MQTGDIKRVRREGELQLALHLVKRVLQAGRQNARETEPAGQAEAPHLRLAFQTRTARCAPEGRKKGGDSAGQKAAGKDGGIAVKSEAGRVNAYNRLYGLGVRFFVPPVPRPCRVPGGLGQRVVQGLRERARQGSRGIRHGRFQREGDAKVRRRWMTLERQIPAQSDFAYQGRALRAESKARGAQQAAWIGLRRVISAGGKQRGHIKREAQPRPRYRTRNAGQ